MPNYLNSLPLLIALTLLMSIFTFACDNSPKNKKRLFLNKEKSLPESYHINTKKQDSSAISENEKKAVSDILTDSKVSLTHSDCIFDLNTQTDDFLQKTPELSNYSWNDSTKTATILLQNNDTLFATRGGCIHFNMRGELIRAYRKPLKENINHWFTEAKWISKSIMPESDFDKLEEMIRAKDYKFSKNIEEGIYLNFTGHIYSEWYLHIYQKEKNTVIETGYYFG